MNTHRHFHNFRHSQGFDPWASQWKYLYNNTQINTHSCVIFGLFLAAEGNQSSTLTLHADVPRLLNVQKHT